MDFKNIATHILNHHAHEYRKQAEALQAENETLKMEHAQTKRKLAVYEKAQKAREEGLKKAQARKTTAKKSKK